jgi:acyl-[acyl-carrier-protein]-phospholipid O-acyltransferase / long-chain-fatty-acid--[acyl-carrier-protein] ligase
MDYQTSIGAAVGILFADSFLWNLLVDSFWIALIPLLALVILACIFRYFFLVRVPLWILTHTLYRLRAHGAENIPEHGPALLVSNHVSYIDALLIMASTKRKVRFLIWAPFMGVPGLRVILRLGNVIPIQGTGGPRSIIQALRTASEALANGEVVCIFAEGGITRTGFLLPFQRGFEQIVKRSPVPIIPICLDHVWGSIFSFEGGKFFWKWPQRLPYKVHVNIGKLLPPTADPFTVRQAIQRLSAESAVRRAKERKPVHRQFVRMAVSHPFRSCLIDANAAKPELTYGETLVGVKILLKRLKPLLGDDPMVGVWLPPSAAGAIANICLACLGKTSVNPNYTSAANIVQSSIQQCGIKKILTSRVFLHKVPLDPGPGVDMIFLEDFRKEITKTERTFAFLGVLLLPGFIHEYLLMGLGRHKIDDLATIIFSSGSTGDPKGVMLTHGNIAANEESAIQAFDPQPPDRLLSILPFFHSFGYTVTLWLPLQVGASTVFHANALQYREIGELCKKHKCTIFVATPTFLRGYLRRCEADDFKSLRLLVCGAEKMPPTLAQEFKQKFGVEPLEGYGCTELSPVAAANVPDWQDEGAKQAGHKPGTIGQPFPGVAARIVHRETLQDLPQGQEGLLLMYGANVMKGYLGRDDLTQKKIVDGGWYITGDLAFIDEDGFITITGREERFAKVGGEMVPLEKVEEELHQVLKTNDKTFAVTAIPDGKKGERIIVLHLALPETTPQAVWKLLNERGLPNIYVPSQRDFYQVPELPILGSGKLDLKRCKQMAQEVAGGNEA